MPVLLLSEILFDEIRIISGGCAGLFEAEEAFAESLGFLHSGRAPDLCFVYMKLELFGSLVECFAVLLRECFPPVVLSKK